MPSAISIHALIYVPLRGGWPFKTRWLETTGLADASGAETGVTEGIVMRVGPSEVEIGCFGGWRLRIGMG
jgi:hypothetical protein